MYGRLWNFCTGLALAQALIACVGTAVAQAVPDVDKPPIDPPKPRWTIGEQKDRLDGKIIVVAQKIASETTLYPHLRKPITNKHAALQISCNKGNTVIYFAVDGSLIGSRDTRVSYRIDEMPPVANLRWNASEDHSAVGIWESGRAVSFVKKLMPSKKIFIRIEHNVFGTTEAEFDTTELAEAMKPIRATCRW
jgi:type VI secretion system VasI family protein